MASKKAIIGIVVVVIIVIIAALALSGGSDGKADVRYDYTAEFADYLGDPDILPTYPSEGNTFIVIQFTLANDWDEAITTNFMATTWSATLDGLTYSQSDFYCVSAPGYQLVDIEPGAQAVSGAVIEVPAGHDLSDFTISFDYDDWVNDLSEERDDTLM